MKMKNIHLLENHWGVLLHRDTLWLEERRGDISTGNEYNLSRAYTQDRRMLHGQYYSKEPS